MKIPKTITNDPGVYVLRCEANGKVYVGKSVRVRHRLLTHRCTLKKGTHDNPHMQRAWNKYGAASFKVVNIIWCCETKLHALEVGTIDCYDALDRRFGFNMQEPTLGGGHRLSDSTREKLRVASTGRKHTADIKKAIGDAARGSRAARAKLDEDAVLIIKRRLQAGDDTLRGLAAEFGVSHAVISAIKSGRSWQHVSLEVN